MGGNLLRPATAVFALGLVGFALHTRYAMNIISTSTGVSFEGWDVVVALTGSPYVVFYWILPFAAWFVLRQLEGTLRPEDVIRMGSRVRWAFHQAWEGLPWMGLIVAATTAAGFIAGIGYPWQLSWGPASLSPEVLLTLPELAPTMPIPALTVLLQAIALIVVLAAFVVVVSLCSVFISWPRTAAIAAVALVFWGVLSFRLADGPIDAIATATYAAPWYADRVFPFGPTSGILVLLIVGLSAFVVAQRLELRARQKVSFTLWSLAFVIGVLVLAGLFLRNLDGTTSPEALVLYALQGTGPAGMSFVNFLGSTVLVMLPAFAVHQRLVSALVERRYSEMIRLGTPARWYLRELAGCLGASFFYAVAMTVAAAALLTAQVGAFPGLRALLLVALWGVALWLQVIVVSIILAFGTVISRRVEGGTVALFVAIAFSVPLGPASDYAPTGQASLLRVIPEAGAPLTALSFMPLIVSLSWILVLTTITSVIFSKTRGELQ